MHNCFVKTFLYTVSQEGKISQGDEGVVVRVRCTKPDMPVPSKVYVMKVLHNVHQKQTATMVSHV